jgi:hypothetical protein
MNKYNEEIYSYLSTPENYTAAKEISRELPKLEEKLKIDFWNELQKSFSHSFEQNYKDGWKEIKLEYNNKEDAWEAYIHKESWRYVRIGIYFEEGFYDLGISLNGKSKNEDIVELVKLDPKYPCLGEGNSESWPCWKSIKDDSIDFNFRVEKDFYQILPVKRESIIKSILKNFEDYVKDAIAVCEQIDIKLK